MYTPPYPHRPKTKASTLRLMLTGGSNLIAGWPDFTFERKSFSFRILTRRVHVLCTPDTVKQVFVDEGMTYLPKTSQQIHALRPLAGDGLIISEGETWRLRRRVVAPATHVSQLPAIAPTIAACAGEMRADWLARDGETIDTLSEMAELTAGVIGATIFGRHLVHDTTKELIAAFGIFQGAVRQTDMLSMFSVPLEFPRYQSPKALRAAKRIHKALDPLIDAVMEPDGVHESSLMRAISEAIAAGRVPAIDRTALRNEACVLFLAGHETTTNTLAWAWYILSQDPESEARLHAEVDAVLGDAPAGFSDFARLPFTRAVIEETLRLYPPIPLQGRRVMQDGRIGAKQIKRGDVVVLNAWILHRHRRLWPNPDAFVPDRFLPGGGAPQSRYAYVPFSIGPRTCTGASLALMEATLCLATLARRLRLRLAPGQAVEPICRLSLRPGPSLRMRIERRA